jgi:hypothetical protein
MLEWLKKLFSDSDEASMSRMLALLALLFGCGWVTYLVIVHKILPDLKDVAVFVGTPYGLGKFGSAFKNLTDK